ncbi:hypothetical protein U0070_007507 [Myodes glareolus]|uniref:Izumo sperm-egg fusion protein 3 n=1 Tax=Myodes glareolus TaxID=447135 RepID=A0AAW0J1M2_MYOGA
MGDLWELLFLSLSLAAFRGVKGCLECDPKFIEDVSTFLGNLVPVEVPGRTQLLDKQHKDITHLSYEVSHKDKTLRLLAVRNVVKLREWLKHEFYTLGNETWKGFFIIQGKLLEIRRNLESQLKGTLTNFAEVDENPKKAENREIALYLILIAEVVILASALLLFHFCITHHRKMKEIRRTLKTYLEKKIEEIVGTVDTDDEKKDLETLTSNSQTGEPLSAESELQSGT